jgi:hypothetical protein
MTPVVRAEALFCSSLQPSQNPTKSQVESAISASMIRYGGAQACVAYVAGQFGEHPDVAAHRMRWALTILGCPPKRSSSC